MGTKHTPGPWRVGEMGGGRIHIEADTTPRHITVAGVHVFDSASREPAANARLVAAAPEMAEFLRWVLPHVLEVEMGNDIVEAERRARALLARIDNGTDTD